MMKTRIALLMAILLLTAALPCSAATVEPLPPAIFRIALAGKTLPAAITGFSYSEGDSAFTVDLTLYERAMYAAGDLKALQPGDEIGIPDGVMTVNTIEEDEYGFSVNRDDSEGSLFLYPDENGNCYAVNEIEHTQWVKTFSFTCAVTAETQFADFSDVEAVDPTPRPSADLLQMLISGEMHFDEENTTVTFDEECRLVKVQLNYTPWN